MKNKFRVNVLGALLATLWVTAAGSSDSPVADAAERGDIETVVALLKQGADVNAAQGDGMTALHWAAMSGNAPLADVLLYAGAATEATTRLGGYTALHLASRVGHEDAIAVLLRQGADASAKTTTGAMPLHLAAASGDVPSITTLLGAGAEVDGREGVYEQTPLMWATARNRLEAMRTLIDSGADVAATTRVVDYGALAELDGPDRQRRQELLNARIQAERAARADRERAEAPAEQAEAPAAAERPAAAPAPAEQPAPAAPAEQPAAAPAQQGAPAEQPAAAQDDQRDAARRALAEARQQGGAPQQGAPAEQPAGAQQPAPAQQGAQQQAGQQPPVEPEVFGYADLVGKEGGLSSLHYAARDGYSEAAELLLARGADVNQRSGDGTTPLLMATINGNYDLALRFLEVGADPNLESEDGAAPLFATLNNRWAPKALFPQPTAFQQQQTDYLEMMTALLDAGADPNHRTKRHIWYTSFNFDLLGVDFMGATPFWRAAYALDVPAMRLLVSRGADPTLATQKPASGRRFRGGAAAGDSDPSGLPPVPTGGPAVFPIHAASGVGYGEGYAANAHRHAPDAWVSAVRYLVEELGADVNTRDHNGYAPLHHAAARGDNELIEYLVSQGADVTLVSRRGQTTVDMANGPVQRISPFPATIELLESLGAINNHNCVGC